MIRLKVAGELLPGVLHVASRSVAKQTGCLYCDYSDVFTTRGVCGFSVPSSLDRLQLPVLSLCAGGSRSCLGGSYCCVALFLCC